jgi:hypothetical protein
MRTSWKRSVLGLLNPFRTAIAGIGQKPGEDDVRRMLLDDFDFSNINFEKKLDHTYRTFASFKSTDAINRARKNGSITAIRIFRDDTKKTSLRIQVTPFVSLNDAVSSVETTIDNFRLKLGRRIEAQNSVEGLIVPEVSGVMVIDILGTGPTGQTGDRILAGAVNNVLLKMSFQADGNIEELWPWGTITEIANRQAQRIHDCS